MSDQLKFTLHHPITEEEWDAIADVDFDHTDNIFFHTKHGKEVEFVKRKKGKWKETDDGWDGTYYVCSVCGCPWTLIDGDPADNGMNYCPNCGARMVDDDIS